MSFRKDDDTLFGSAWVDNLVRDTVFHDSNLTATAVFDTEGAVGVQRLQFTLQVSIIDMVLQNRHCLIQDDLWSVDLWTYLQWQYGT